MSFHSESLYSFFRPISPDEMALRWRLKTQCLPMAPSRQPSLMNLDDWDPFPEARSPSSELEAKKTNYSASFFVPYPPSLGFAMLTGFGRGNQPFVGRVRCLNYDINSPCIDTKHLTIGVRDGQDPLESAVDLDSDDGSPRPKNAREEFTEEVTTNGRLPCQWRRMFGGHCRAEFENRQQHDRHVLSHIPDTGGVLWASYKCRLCLENREEVVQNAITSGRMGKQDVGLFARKDPCVRHIRNLHFDGNANDSAQDLIEDSDPWWWPSTLFYTSTYRKPEDRLKPRPDGESRNWKEYLNDILLQYPSARTKPLEPVEALKRDLGLIDEGPPAGRPTKRQRIER